MLLWWPGVVGKIWRRALLFCVCDVVVVVVEVVVGKVVVVAVVYKGDLTDTIAEPIASG